MLNIICTVCNLIILLGNNNKKKNMKRAIRFLLGADVMAGLHVSIHEIYSQLHYFVDYAI